MKQHPPTQIFEKLVNKNAIKCKIGAPPMAIFPETIDPPPPDFGKNFKYPPWQFFLKPLTPPPPRFWQKLQVPPWIFNLCASMT